MIALAYLILFRKYVKISWTLKTLRFLSISSNQTATHVGETPEKFPLCWTHGSQLEWLLQKLPFSHYQGYRVSNYKVRELFRGKKNQTKPQKNPTTNFFFTFASFVVNIPRLKLFHGHLLQTFALCCSVQSFRTFFPFSRARDLHHSAI